ncbi:MAG: metallophosphoesterase [Anaerolineae bacterium]|nr:metallophosphoesterase [Anaerolineae bacterium]
MEVSYLEFISSALNLPLYYVRGNHDTHYEPGHPGGVDLHLKIREFKGLALAGLQGSPYYNGKNIQHTEAEMSTFCLRLLPRLVVRRHTHGHGLDYLVTHSPPRGIHDRPDKTHQGFASFLWFMRLGQPRYLIHGHIDIWDNRESRMTKYYETLVININPKRLLIPDKDDKNE